MLYSDTPRCGSEATRCVSTKCSATALQNKECDPDNTASPVRFSFYLSTDARGGCGRARELVCLSSAVNQENHFSLAYFSHPGAITPMGANTRMITASTLHARSGVVLSPYHRSVVSHIPMCFSTSPPASLLKGVKRPCTPTTTSQASLLPFHVPYALLDEFQPPHAVPPAPKQRWLMFNDACQPSHRAHPGTRRKRSASHNPFVFAQNQTHNPIPAREKNKSANQHPGWNMPVIIMSGTATFEGAGFDEHSNTGPFHGSEQKPNQAVPVPTGETSGVWNPSPSACGSTRTPRTACRRSPLAASAS